jgi:hypothetical protein
MQRAVRPTRGHVFTCDGVATMIKHLDRIGKFVLGAAIVGALGFGATQAVAAPSESAGLFEASRCTDHDPCDVYCTNHGYLAGKCINWACNCLTSSGTWVPVPY